MSVFVPQIAILKSPAMLKILVAAPASSNVWNAAATEIREIVGPDCGCVECREPAIVSSASSKISLNGVSNGDQVNRTNKVPF
jgi:hypothetical protein